MDFLKGHDGIRKSLEDAVAARRLPQTLLFYGLDGIGKRRVALELVAKLFIKADTAAGLFDGAEQAAGESQLNVSLQKLLSGNHPDFFWIRPTSTKSEQKKMRDDEDGDAQSSSWMAEIQANWTIKTEQIQELKTKLTHYPLMADYQVVLIEDAEKMTTTTANSLLKMLEEPRANQIFILVSGQFHRVLSTLRSRSAKYFFAPLERDLVREIVTGAAHESEFAMNDSDFDFLYQCFHGSVAPIIRVLRQNLPLKNLRSLVLGETNFVEVASLVAQISEQGDLPTVLRILRSARVQGIRQNGFAVREDLEYFDRIRQAEFQLSRHIPGDFVLENLFL